MRISDWRSDVCSSDLGTDVCPTCYQAPMIDCSVCGQHALGRRTTKEGQPWCFACQATERIDQLLAAADRSIPDGLKDVRDVLAIGRASCRERVCNYV